MGKAENAVTKAVRQACQIRGALVVRVQAGGHRVGKHFVRGAEPGTADLIGAFMGRPIALEVKTAKGKQQLTQALWQVEWQRAGGIYAIVRSAEDTLKVLADIEMGEL